MVWGLNSLLTSWLGVVDGVVKDPWGWVRDLWRSWWRVLGDLPGKDPCRICWSGSGGVVTLAIYLLQLLVFGRQVDCLQERFERRKSFFGAPFSYMRA